MSGPQTSGTDRRHRRPFQKTRAGVPLTKEEVRQIKRDRKKLREDLRAVGICSKEEFETTAATMGLYFDKPRWLLILPWLFGGRGLWMLLALAGLLLLALFAMAKISELRGYFTINLADDLFREGFLLDDSADFDNPSANLFCEPAVDVPCISITSLGKDIDSFEGQHNGFGYFAYTCFLKNQGESTVDYSWTLQITGESKDCSTAAWVMVIEDGKMQLFAEAQLGGQPQTVPALDDESRGYLDIPVMALAEDVATYLQPVKTVGSATYYRIHTKPFESEDAVATGYQSGVAPGDVHKYTVVVWLEGDDPDCTDDRIGGHLGLSMQYELEGITED